MQVAAADSIVSVATSCAASPSGWGAFAGFLGGAAIAVAAEPIRQRLFAPTLGLYYEDNSDHLASTPAYVAQHEVQALYVRAKVVNHSLLLAKRCRVFLVNIERQDSTGEFSRTLYCDSIQLAWAVREGQQYEALDVPHSVPFFVDIFSTLEGAPGIQPHVRSLPLRYVSLFSAPSTLRLSLRVAGDGAKAAELKLVVEWKGTWNSIAIRAA